MKILQILSAHSRKVPGLKSEFILSRLGTKDNILPIRRWKHVEKGEIDAKAEGKPVKFSTSEAHINYVASRNFYGDEDRNLPPSHNYMLSSTGILGIFYLIFLRDDIEADGGMALFQPIHEQVPQYAIPLLQSSIAENKRLGFSTIKLEKKLAEYMKEPEKHGGHIKKLVEN